MPDEKPETQTTPETLPRIEDLGERKDEVKGGGITIGVGDVALRD